MQKLVFTNGNGVEVDLTDFEKYGVTEWSGLSNTTLNIQTQQVPFNDGSVFLDALLNDRTISVKIAINDGGDLATRYELKRELIAILNPKLGEGVLTYTNDYLSKQITVIPNQPIFANKNSNGKGTLKADVSFTACNPYWEDTEETIVTTNKGVISVSNEGDVATPLQIDLFTTSASDTKLENITNGNVIKFNDDIENIVKIKTGMGQKSIIQSSINLKKFVSREVHCIVYSQPLNLYLSVQDTSIYGSTDCISWDLLAENVGEILSMIYVSNIGKFVGVSSEGNYYLSSNGETWETVTYSYGTALYSITYSSTLNLLVAVGANGYIAVSSDGETWEEIESNITDNLRSIIYSTSLGLFIVAGNNGTILTSSTGLVWTQATSGVTTLLSGVCFAESKGICVIAGASGTVLKSTDGENWEEIGVSSNYTGKTIVYSEVLGAFFIVGYYTAPFILRSYDGETWESVWDGEEYIQTIYADDYNGILITGGLSTSILTSYDGETWTVREGFPVLYPYFSDIAYSSDLNLFVVISTNIFSSSDGITWAQSDYVSSSTLKSIAYSETLGVFIIVGEGIILKSTDGESWEEVESSINFTLIKCIEDSELFIATDGTYIYTSSDGETWNQRTTDSNSILGFCYSKELGIYVAVGSRTILTSEDSITWVEQTTNKFLNSVTYANNIGFIASGISGLILTSRNGNVWTKKTISVTDSLTNINYVEQWGLIVASGAGQDVAISYDGETWTIYSTNSYYYLTNGCYGSNIDKYIMVGAFGSIFTLYIKEEENIINKLAEDSEMMMNLEVGENVIKLSSTDNIHARLTYRNRYLGV